MYNFSFSSIKRFFLAAIFTLVLGSCSVESDDAVLEPGFDLVSAFLFVEDFQDWEVGFSEYPKNIEDSLVLRSAIGQMPVRMGIFSNGLRISSNNITGGDLFHFMKIKIEGLEANQDYDIVMEFEMAFEAIGDLAGLQQNRIAVKVGASDQEPLAVLPPLPEGETEDSFNQFVSFSHSMGAIGQDGQDMINVGNVIAGSQEYDKLILVENSGKIFTQNTNGDGNIWLMLGFLSEVPLPVNIFVKQIVVYYRKVN